MLAKALLSCQITTKEILQSPLIHFSASPETSTCSVTDRSSAPTGLKFI